MELHDRISKVLDKAIETAINDVLADIRHKPKDRAELLPVLDAFPYLKAGVTKQLETMRNAGTDD